MLTFKANNFFDTPSPPNVYVGLFSQDSQPPGFMHAFFLTHHSLSCTNVNTSFADFSKLLGPQ